MEVLSCVLVPWSRDCFSQHSYQSSQYYTLYRLTPCFSSMAMLKPWWEMGTHQRVPFTVFQSLAHNHISAIVSTAVLEIQIFQQYCIWGAQWPPLVCSCSWVLVRLCKLDWRDHLPAESSLSLITQEWWESPILPTPWTTAADPAR